MRNELIFTLRALADPVYQRMVWVGLERPRVPYYDSFSEAIHFVFDDMSLDSHLDQAIGRILSDSSEAEAIQKLVGALNTVLDGVGLDATDEEYINSPHWDDVLQTARKAYALVTGGQSAEGMFLDLKSGWNPGFGRTGQPGE
jgi:hypothetical protein